MSELIVNRYNPDFVSPPGETLLETLEAIGMSQAQLAERAGRPKKTINEIIGGKTAITSETALQLERVLGIPSSFWTRREAEYRESLARHDEENRLHKEVQWLGKFPVKALAKLGWITDHHDDVQNLQELLSFFGVATPEGWKKIWQTTLPVDFRKSVAFAADHAALTAWLRKGELEAQQIDCSPYDRDSFRDHALDLARGLTSERPEVFCPKLIIACRAVGVAVVFVHELPKTRVSGATRWLTPTKAMIQLSRRYKTNDQLWFTFFHEAGHILLHGKRDVFLEGETDNGSKEDEAAMFAEERLIPRDPLEAFKQEGEKSKGAIINFAGELGIAPGIVVGRLQHDKYLLPSHCNGLKQRLEWTQRA
jgi:addiction module HigA family antidote